MNRDGEVLGLLVGLTILSGLLHLLAWCITLWYGC